nr:MAG: hypothetical protein [Bacteriophage sp.]
MGEVKEPYEGGTGSLLEVVDMMCGVTEKLAEDDLDRIEMKLRRI